MKKYTLVFNFVISLFLAGCMGKYSEIENCVRNLEITDVNDFLREMTILEKNPRVACKYLIAELQVVQEKHISGYSQKNNMRTMHIIWCLRALRALTGKKMYSKTIHELDLKDEKDRAYWLLKDHKDKMPFFAVWMSRDSTYIAPPEIQKDIINKWKLWYIDESMSYDYRSSKQINIEHFYF